MSEERFDPGLKYIGTGEYVPVMEWSAEGEYVRHSCIANLEKKLAERDAALARCVEALRELRGVAHTPGGITLAAVIDDTLAFLPASAQATTKVQQWQPIETAPKDDNKHVLLFGDGPAIRECCYVGYLSPARVNDSGIDEWKEMASGYVMRPTHWMPLPEPPTEAIREEKETK